MNSVRIALFAGNNALAEAFRRRLQQTRWAPVAVFKPTFAGSPVTGLLRPSPQDRSVREPDGVLDSSVPIVHAGALDQRVRQQLHQHGIDLIVSICFPRRIPTTILGSIDLGGLNLHPSPLPAWRGADPVFWQLRQGCNTIGLSLHWMTDVIDGGAVIARDAIALDAIHSMAALEQCIADQGVDLLTEALREDRVRARSDGADNTAILRGFRFPAPCAADYRFWTSWRTAHLRRFLQLLAPRNNVFSLADSSGVQHFDGLFDEAKHDASRRRVVELSDGQVALHRAVKPSLQKSP